MQQNWTQTLFVWDGILSLVEKDGGRAEEDVATGDGDEIKWEGTWVGFDSVDATKVDAPKRGPFDEFVSSEHKFDVNGWAIKGDKEDIEAEEDNEVIGGKVSLLYQAKMINGPGYDLRMGEGVTKHNDTVHDVYFSTLRWKGNLRDQVENVVFALGENEFGNFISVGWMRVGNRVTMARRYIDKDDDRRKWDIDDLRKAVFDQITSISKDGHMSIIIPPWQCAAMHADPGQITKRQKTDLKN
ncbi:hypothetical protein HJC23_013434 [Cyclotella cryptica]|uniref:Uncharacterized protein n=1 Tax=Cyclotella cryptica TaxID=29204 RepID=A0ABD3P7J8_9STRA|eukprot:CCRYP_017821-RA/>CCRYP_017821-RA protein AED:0.00 eAED:0.00 QI:106/-1/1/1/-1/1/1/371/241